jgi:TDG/mug DNA glycosylase family protein
MVNEPGAPPRGRKPLPARVAAVGSAWSVGFPAVADEAARVLILGSLPGRRSLEQQQYYAQPYNTFWRIMERLCGAAPSLPYAQRLQRLRASGIALWDVLAAGDRQGSLDSAIVAANMVVNDFASFFTRQPRIRVVCFNGRKAEEVFRRRVARELPQLLAAKLTFELLPSTSPAFASLTFEQKLERWSAVLAPHLAAPRRG